VLHCLADFADCATDNLAFLIKYTGGANVQADQISVTVIDVRGPNNSKVGHKITVSLHEGPGNFTVVIWKQVKWGGNVIIGLSEKADKVIKEILAKEGHKGYGDFKM
jgi:archaellum component FlaG (FlaF/FlaG flagellin family)